ncbi:MAG: prenyltransferase/squalene oxidase repeat-containing protein [Pirellulaceae bacterium]
MPNLILRLTLPLFILTPFITPVVLAQEQFATPDPEAVKTCIERAVDYLKNNQGESSWREYNNDPRFKGGTTALAVLALITAGEDPNTPEMRKALQFIERTPNMERRSVYGIALRILVLLAADPDRRLYGRTIENDVQWLVDNQTIEGRFAGGWGYEFRSDYSDNSLSQFALLALHEASLSGIAIEEQVWRSAEQYWVGGASLRGGYGYKRLEGNKVSGSMTCAAISSLEIIRENLLKPKDFIKNGKVLGCAKFERYDASDRAIHWLTNNFAVSRNPSGGAIHKYYYLYGLERAARLSGLRFFGDNDWYREGTAHLLTQQKTTAPLQVLAVMTSSIPVLHCCFWLRGCDRSCLANINT